MVIDLHSHALDRWIPARSLERHPVFQPAIQLQPNALMQGSRCMLADIATQRLASV
ncbi:hypothetical protein [Polaromonas sp. CG9_12]|nr:hypothetical protein [Polaromonas sp. CG9_12]